MRYEDITVVIPVKERFNLLKLALQSINNQSLLPKYVMIVDDASKKKINLTKKYKFYIKIIENKNQ